MGVPAGMKKPFCSSEKQALAKNAEGQRRKSRQVTTYPADILGSLVLETCKKEDYDALTIWQLDNVVEYLPPELTGRHRYVSRMKAHVTGRSSWSSNVGTVRKRSMQHKLGTHLPSDVQYLHLSRPTTLSNSSCTRFWASGYTAAAMIMMLMALADCY